MQLTPWPIGLKHLLLTCRDKTSITKIHALMVTSGLYANANYVGCLISSYSRDGGIETARQVFDELPKRGVNAWNSIITAYSRERCPNQVLGLYRRMIAEGVRPDSSTFTLALKACSSMTDLEVGKDVWQQAVAFGYRGDVFVASSVLNLFAKCGRMDEAKKVFDKMVKRDVVSWTTMVTGFIRSGQALEAVDMHRTMQKEGIEGDGVVMVGLIKACSDLGETKVGHSVHGYIVRREIHMNDVVVQTSLVDLYAKNGHLELASRVFREIRFQNAASWGALISGYAQNGFAGNALESFVDMQSHGIKPDSVSLVSAVLACSKVGHLKLGKSIHGYVLRRLDVEQNLVTAFIDLYAKCGSLVSGRVLFDQAISRDVIMWNAMISSYGIHGHGNEALSLFVEMTGTDAKPDHTTFASLLSALSHSGLVEAGQYWFHKMVYEFKIQASEKLVVCMVDLLSRAGRVEEAYQLIESMDSEPGLAVWVALLSGCHNYKNISVGEEAAKKILASNANDSGTYSLVSNFFSMAKKWDEVRGSRRMMKRTGLRKVPGFSAVEVNGKHQAFLMEDRTHHQYEGD
ncbi:Putative pentatricopeptide repeat-containing protein At3g25060, mitochondrial [Linum grandiflorum]